MTDDVCNRREHMQKVNRRMYVSDGALVTEARKG